jgi:hypothetical protein
MKNLIFISMVFLPEFLFGQYNYMALNFGISHPIGSYAANKDLMNEGFAVNGLTADYSGAYFLFRHIGIAGDIQYTSNGLDDQSAQSLLQQLPVMNLNSDTTISYDLGYWKHVSFMAGPQYTFSSGKLNVDLYVLAGLSFVMNPSVGITVTYYDQSYSHTTWPEYVRFGFDAGASVRYKLSDRYGIRLFASYFQSSGKGDTENELNIDAKQISIKSFYTNVYTLNFGIGIIYVLNDNFQESDNTPISY